NVIRDGPLVPIIHLKGAFSCRQVVAIRTKAIGLQVFFLLPHFLGAANSDEYSFPNRAVVELNVAKNLGRERRDREQKKYQKQNSNLSHFILLDLRFKGEFPVAGRISKCGSWQRPSL